MQTNTSQHQHGILLKILILLILYIAATDFTIVASILPMMVKQFSQHQVLYPWLMSGFILANILSVAVAGSLADKYGIKPLTLISMLLFLLGNVICCCAHTMPQLIIARCIQGVGSGALIVLVYVLLAKIASSAIERNHAQGLISLVWGLSVVSGPFVGMLIYQLAGWRMVFLTIFIFATVILCLFSYFYRSTNDTRLTKKIVINWLAILSFTCFLATLLCLSMIFSISLFYRYASLIILIGMGAYFIYYKTVNQYRERDVFPRHIFYDSLLLHSAFNTFIAALIVYSSMILLPFLLVHQYPHHAYYSSLIIFSGAIGWVMSAMICAKKLHTSWSKYFILFGSMALVLGTLMLFANLYHGVFMVYMLGEIFCGIGIGMIATTTLIWFQDSAAEHELSRFTAAVQLIRNIGAALGINLISALQYYYSQNQQHTLFGYEVSLVILLGLAMLAIFSVVFFLGKNRFAILQ